LHQIGIQCQTTFRVTGNHGTPPQRRWRNLIRSRNEVKRITQVPVVNGHLAACRTYGFNDAQHTDYIKYFYLLKLHMHQQNQWVVCKIRQLASGGANKSARTMRAVLQLSEAKLARFPPI